WITLKQRKERILKGLYNNLAATLETVQNTQYHYNETAKLANGIYKHNQNILIQKKPLCIYGKSGPPGYSKAKHDLS
ncbi:22656_t:CDS:1, partial [Gigaspora rosea]